MNSLELQIQATKVRKGILTEVFNANSGHPGGSLSAADMYTYLFFEEMNIDPSNPKDENRDRFVLSKGHTSPGLYSALAHRGYFDVEELSTFRKLGTRLQGHPCMNETPGVDMSSGSLGQGLSAACGMALAGKLQNKDYRVFCLVGDGEIQEGQIWEAAMFAGAKNLSNLTLIVDNNGLQIDGKVEDVCSVYPIKEKFEAFNFNVVEIDGHNFDEIKEAFIMFKANKNNDKPNCIVMHTTKGKGVSYMEGKAGWHGKAPNTDEYAQAINELDALLSALENQGKAV